jgi:hypothetical protein
MKKSITKSLSKKQRFKVQKEMQRKRIEKKDMKDFISSIVAITTIGDCKKH